MIAKQFATAPSINIKKALLDYTKDYVVHNLLPAVTTQFFRESDKLGMNTTALPCCLTSC